MPESLKQKKHPVICYWVPALESYLIVQIWSDYAKPSSEKSGIWECQITLKNTPEIVRQPLTANETADKFDVLVNVRGGGYTGQAGAIRHGIARALLNVDADYRPVLKKAGFLTRDPRMKERKKYGLKAARRAPQFSKR